MTPKESVNRRKLLVRAVTVAVVAGYLYCRWRGFGCTEGSRNASLITGNSARAPLKLQKDRRPHSEKLRY